MKLKANNPLGKTGLSVPRIIYGTSYLGNLYRAISYEEKLAIISKWYSCTETPVTIDSAGKYGAGLALETIGRGLNDLGIDPVDVIISNKLGWYRVPLSGPEPTFEPGAWADLEFDAVQLFGYEGILKCFEQGNELLGGKYRARIVSVHDPDEYLQAAKDQDEREQRYKEILESYRALFDLKKKGEVTAVGVGSKDWTIIRELYHDVPFDWVMIANSFTVYSHPAELVEFMDLLHREGVGIINSALFQGGFLTGGKTFNYRYVDPESDFGKELFKWRNDFYETCEEYQVKPAEVCIHFGLSHPAITSIALNTSKPGKMDNNVALLNREIPLEFWKIMKEKELIDSEYRYV